MVQPQQDTPSSVPSTKSSCIAGRCSCGSDASGVLARREFIKLGGLAAAGLVLGDLPVMAGPFTREDFQKLVPLDKRLTPEWTRSLTERGTPAVFRWPQSEKIGMPIGGVTCGQVYIGGDGRLWHWDIFNRHVGTGAEHYAKPMLPASPFEQGFAVRVTRAGSSQVRRLDHTGWAEVSFHGQYPIAKVAYKDPDCPVTATLEAFSPFIPLNTADSSLPVTVLQWRLTNTSSQAAEVEIAGWLENALCPQSSNVHAVQRVNRVLRTQGRVFLECGARQGPEDANRRPDVVFEEFDKPAYEGWSVTGTAFGQGPVSQKQVPDYQGTLGIHGERTVNTHSASPASDVGARDAAKGVLTSKTFTIDRRYITFLIGGGSHKGKTCLNLLVDGSAVASATGADDNRMRPASLDVRQWVGKTGQLQIVDDESGGWGNIGVDHIVFSDGPSVPQGPLEQEPDFGTMGIALLEGQAGQTEFASSAIGAGAAGEKAFDASARSDAPAVQTEGQPLIGTLGRRLSLIAGGSTTVTFLVAWHLPNLKMDRLPPGRFYGQRFSSAKAVADYVAGDFDRLAGQTRLWHDTWYDSTLPYWFLDRTFLNTSILATSTCFRFGDGRFWAWEGVGCCHGTCGHVWQYAHAMARLFPELERMTREHVDFGLAMRPDGAIHFRGEFNDFPAIDSQAGTVLRALREHQMSTDAAFLKRNWPQIKRAAQWLMAKDANADGVIEGNQHNTLDTDWFGPVAWLSGLYLAALLASEEMAKEAGDLDFAGQCRAIVEKGRKKLVTELFDGEYFINKVDPGHADAINSGTGCEIDQVFGQSWAFQVGLHRVLPEKETRAALQSLWKYNFTPDVGPYREAYKPGRWYAMPGEAGLLMCTFPRSGWDYSQAKGKGADWAAGYFNECMNGFEYQVAGHMIWEGMVQEGLAVTRAVHDRYHATRRNPWNEVECGDHYARSMASYGVFLAACGYEVHGPKGHLGFAPRLRPEDFTAAFTAPEGWGRFSQKAEGSRQIVRIEIRWGRLRLKTLALGLVEGVSGASVQVRLTGKPIKAGLKVEGRRALVTLSPDVVLNTRDVLEFTVV